MFKNVQSCTEGTVSRMQMTRNTVTTKKQPSVLPGFSVVVTTILL